MWFELFAASLAVLTTFHAAGNIIESTVFELGKIHSGSVDFNGKF